MGPKSWNPEAAHDRRREQGRQDRLEREKLPNDDRLDPEDEDLSAEEQELRKRQEEEMDGYLQDVPSDNF